MKKTLLLFLLGFYSLTFGQTQLAGWTFDVLAASPSTPTSVLANIGAQSGTAALYADGTNGSSTWLQASELNSFGGSTVNDPRGASASAGSAYCPIGGTSTSANGKAIVFKISMTGYISPIITYATRNTSTGFSTQQWAYSTDGTSFTNTTAITGITTSFVTKTVDLSAVTAVNNAATLYLKVTFSGATNATGNNRLDNILINATAPINDGDGSATLTNAFGSGVLNGTTIFPMNTTTQSVKVSVTGTAAGALSKVSVTIPSDWTWTGSASDVAPSSDDAASLTAETVTGSGSVGSPWVISYTGTITSANLGKITISNLTSPNTSTITNNGNYSFIVKTAKSTGTLTALTNGSPIAYVIIPLANIRNQSAGVPVLNSNFVASQGVATVASGVFSAAQLQGYMQDGTSGVNVFILGTPPTMVEGNSYIVKGQVQVFNGNTELSPSATTDIINNGVSTMPDPTVVSLATLIANPETYEGRYIAVQNVSLSSGTWPATTGAASSGVTLVITDGTNTINLFVDYDTDVDGNVEPTWPVDIKGIFYQSASAPTYVLSPRHFATDFAPAGTLPVELTSFSSRVINGNPILNWQTATEINNSGFAVLRSSANNSKWEKIAFINGAGTSNSPKSYSYIDKSALAGKYSYKLKQIDNNGSYKFSAETSVDLGSPDKFIMEQNYPNPFNPSTVISYYVPADAKVTLRVFNALGTEVSTLVNEFQTAGAHTVNFTSSGLHLSSGIYFYKLQSGSFTAVKRMMLIK